MSNSQLSSSQQYFFSDGHGKSLPRAEVKSQITGGEYFSQSNNRNISPLRQNTLHGYYHPYRQQPTIRNLVPSHRLLQGLPQKNTMIYV